MGDFSPADFPKVGRGFKAASNVISLTSRHRRQVSQPHQAHALRVWAQARLPGLSRSKIADIGSRLTRKVVTALARPPANDAKPPISLVRPVSLRKRRPAVSLAKPVSLARPQKTPAPVIELTPPVSLVRPDRPRRVKPAPVVIPEPVPVIETAAPQKRGTLTLKSKAAPAVTQDVNITAVAQTPREILSSDRTQAFRTAGMIMTTPAADLPAVSTVSVRATEARPGTSFAQNGGKRETLRLSKKMTLTAVPHSRVTRNSPLGEVAALFRNAQQEITGQTPVATQQQAQPAKQSWDSMVAEAQARAARSATQSGSKRMSDAEFKAQFQAGLRSNESAAPSSSPAAVSRDVFQRGEKKPAAVTSLALHKARRTYSNVA